MDYKFLIFIMILLKLKCLCWVFELSEYQFDIEYVKGCDNVVSDVLSCVFIEDDEIELFVMVVICQM